MPRRNKRLPYPHYVLRDCIDDLLDSDSDDDNDNGCGYDVDVEPRRIIVQQASTQACSRMTKILTKVKNEMEKTANHTEDGGLTQAGLRNIQYMIDAIIEGEAALRDDDGEETKDKDRPRRVLTSAEKILSELQSILVPEHVKSHEYIHAIVASLRNLFTDAETAENDSAMKLAMERQLRAIEKNFERLCPSAPAPVPVPVHMPAADDEYTQALKHIARESGMSREQVINDQSDLELTYKRTTTSGLGDVDDLQREIARLKREISSLKSASTDTWCISRRQLAELLPDMSGSLGDDSDRSTDALAFDQLKQSMDELKRIARSVDGLPITADLVQTSDKVQTLVDHFNNPARDYLVDRFVDQLYDQFRIEDDVVTKRGMKTALKDDAHAREFVLVSSFTWDDIQGQLADIDDMFNYIEELRGQLEGMNELDNTVRIWAMGDDFTGASLLGAGPLADHHPKRKRWDMGSIATIMNKVKDVGHRYATLRTQLKETDIPNLEAIRRELEEEEKSDLLVNVHHQLERVQGEIIEAAKEWDRAIRFYFSADETLLLSDLVKQAHEELHKHADSATFAAMIEQVGNKISSLQDDLNAKDEEIERLQQQLTEATSAATAASASLSDATAAQEAKIRDLQDQNEALDEQVKDLQEQVNKLQQTNAALQAKIEDLEKEPTPAPSPAAGLGDDEEEVEDSRDKTIHELQEEMKANEEKIAELDDIIKGLRAEVDKNATLPGTLAEKEATISKLEEEMAATTAAKEEAEGKIAGFERQIEELTTARTTLSDDQALCDKARDKVKELIVLSSKTSDDDLHKKLKDFLFSDGSADDLYLIDAAMQANITVIGKRVQEIDLPESTMAIEGTPRTILVLDGMKQILGLAAEDDHMFKRLNEWKEDVSILQQIRDDLSVTDSSPPLPELIKTRVQAAAILEAERKEIASALEYKEHEGEVTTSSSLSLVDHARNVHDQMQSCARTHEDLTTQLSRKEEELARKQQELTNCLTSSGAMDDAMKARLDECTQQARELQEIREALQAFFEGDGDSGAQVNSLIALADMQQETINDIAKELKTTEDNLVSRVHEIVAQATARSPLSDEEEVKQEDEDEEEDIQTGMDLEGQLASLQQCIEEKKELEAQIARLQEEQARMEAPSTAMSQMNALIQKENRSRFHRILKAVFGALVKIFPADECNHLHELTKMLLDSVDDKPVRRSMGMGDDDRDDSGPSERLFSMSSAGAQQRLEISAAYEAFVKETCNQLQNQARNSVQVTCRGKRQQQPQPPAAPVPIPPARALPRDSQTALEQKLLVNMMELAVRNLNNRIVLDFLDQVGGLEYVMTDYPGIVTLLISYLTAAVSDSSSIVNWSVDLGADRYRSSSLSGMSDLLQKYSEQEHVDIDPALLDTLRQDDATNFQPSSGSQAHVADVNSWIVEKYYEVADVFGAQGKFPEIEELEYGDDAWLDLMKKFATENKFGTKMDAFAFIDILLRWYFQMEDVPSGDEGEILFANVQHFITSGTSEFPNAEKVLAELKSIAGWTGRRPSNTVVQELRNKYITEFIDAQPGNAANKEAAKAEFIKATNARTMSDTSPSGASVVMGKKYMALRSLLSMKTHDDWRKNGKNIVMFVESPGGGTSLIYILWYQTMVAQPAQGASRVLGLPTLGADPPRLGDGDEEEEEEQKVDEEEVNPVNTTQGMISLLEKLENRVAHATSDEGQKERAKELQQMLKFMKEKQSVQDTPGYTAKLQKLVVNMYGKIVVPILQTALSLRTDDSSSVFGSEDERNKLILSIRYLATDVHTLKDADEFIMRVTSMSDAAATIYNKNIITVLSSRGMFETETPMDIEDENNFDGYVENFTTWLVANDYITDPNDVFASASTPGQQVANLSENVLAALEWSQSLLDEDNGEVPEIVDVLGGKQAWEGMLDALYDSLYQEVSKDEEDMWLFDSVIKPAVVDFAPAGLQESASFRSWVGGLRNFIYAVWYCNRNLFNVVQSLVLIMQRAKTLGNNDIHMRLNGACDMIIECRDVLAQSRDHWTTVNQRAVMEAILIEQMLGKLVVDGTNATDVIQLCRSVVRQVRMDADQQDVTMDEEQSQQVDENLLQQSDMIEYQFKQAMSQIGSDIDSAATRRNIVDWMTQKLREADRSGQDEDTFRVVVDMMLPESVEGRQSRQLRFNFSNFLHHWFHVQQDVMFQQSITFADGSVFDTIAPDMESMIIREHVPDLGPAPQPPAVTYPEDWDEDRKVEWWQSPASDEWRQTPEYQAYLQELTAWKNKQRGYRVGAAIGIIPAMETVLNVLLPILQGETLATAERALAEATDDYKKAQSAYSQLGMAIQQQGEERRKEIEQEKERIKKVYESVDRVPDMYRNMAVYLQTSYQNVLWKIHDLTVQLKEAKAREGPSSTPTPAPTATSTAESKDEMDLTIDAEKFINSIADKVRHNYADIKEAVRLNNHVTWERMPKHILVADIMNKHDLLADSLYIYEAWKQVWKEHGTLRQELQEAKAQLNALKDSAKAQLKPASLKPEGMNKNTELRKMVEKLTSENAVLQAQVKYTQTLEKLNVAFKNIVAQKGGSGGAKISPEQLKAMETQLNQLVTELPGQFGKVMPAMSGDAIKTELTTFFNKPEVLAAMKTYAIIQAFIAENTLPDGSVDATQTLTIGELFNMASKLREPHSMAPIVSNLLSAPPAPAHVTPPAFVENVYDFPAYANTAMTRAKEIQAQYASDIVKLGADNTTKTTEHAEPAALVHYSDNVQRYFAFRYLFYASKINELLETSMDEEGHDDAKRFLANIHDKVIEAARLGQAANAFRRVKAMSVLRLNTPGGASDDISFMHALENRSMNLYYRVKFDEAEQNAEITTKINFNTPYLYMKVHRLLYQFLAKPDAAACRDNLIAALNEPITVNDGLRSEHLKESLKLVLQPMELYVKKIAEQQVEFKNRLLKEYYEPHAVDLAKDVLPIKLCTTSVEAMTAFMSRQRSNKESEGLGTLKSKLFAIDKAVQRVTNPAEVRTWIDEFFRSVFTTTDLGQLLATYAQCKAAGGTTSVIVNASVDLQPILQFLKGLEDSTLEDSMMIDMFVSAITPKIEHALREVARIEKPTAPAVPAAPAISAQNIQDLQEILTFIQAMDTAAMVLPVNTETSKQKVNDAVKEYQNWQLTQFRDMDRLLREEEKETEDAMNVEPLIDEQRDVVQQLVNHELDGMDDLCKNKVMRYIEEMKAALAVAESSTEEEKADSVEMLVTRQRDVVQELVNHEFDGMDDICKEKVMRYIERMNAVLSTSEEQEEGDLAILPGIVTDVKDRIAKIVEEEVAQTVHDTKQSILDQLKAIPFASSDSEDERIPGLDPSHLIDLFQKAIAEKEHEIKQAILDQLKEISFPVDESEGDAGSDFDFRSTKHAMIQLIEEEAEARRAKILASIQTFVNELRELAKPPPPAPIDGEVIHFSVDIRPTINKVTELIREDEAVKLEPVKMQLKELLELITQQQGDEEMNIPVIDFTSTQQRIFHLLQQIQDCPSLPSDIVSKLQTLQRELVQDDDMEDLSSVSETVMHATVNMMTILVSDVIADIQTMHEFQFELPSMDHIKKEIMDVFTAQLPVLRDLLAALQEEHGSNIDISKPVQVVKEQVLKAIHDMPETPNVLPALRELLATFQQKQEEHEDMPGVDVAEPVRIVMEQLRSIFTTMPTDNDDDAQVDVINQMQAVKEQVLKVIRDMPETPNVLPALQDLLATFQQEQEEHEDMLNVDVDVAEPVRIVMNELKHVMNNVTKDEDEDTPIVLTDERVDELKELMHQFADSKCIQNPLLMDNNMLPSDITPVIVEAIKEVILRRQGSGDVLHVLDDLVQHPHALKLAILSRIQRDLLVRTPDFLDDAAEESAEEEEDDNNMGDEEGK